MPAYNEEHYIEACIASVQAQDYPRELIEILIADGRSTDRTREILSRLAAADPRIPAAYTRANATNVRAAWRQLRAELDREVRAL